MMAGRSDVRKNGELFIGIEMPYPAPTFLLFQPIHRVAGNHASFASATRIQVYFESVLLVFVGRSRWQQSFVIFCLGWLVAKCLMCDRELLDSRQVRLFLQQSLQELLACLFRFS